MSATIKVSQIQFTLSPDSFLAIEMWRKNYSSGVKLRVSYYAIEVNANGVLFIIEKEFYTFSTMLIYERNKLHIEAKQIIESYVSP